jgi:alanyl-tRNA synthetase
VDEALRKRTAVNHTATHMLHAALRTTLGDRVKQAGSLVDPTRLRFDFTFPRSVTAEEKTKIENILNQEILAARPVEHREMSYDEAIKSGALAFFDEKYGDRVRVISMAGADKPFSVELCGGTHLKNSAEIGVFKIVSESSVASGVRRIEAITSERAIGYLNERDSLMSRLEEKLGAKSDDVSKKLDQLLEENRELKKANEQLRLKVAQGGARGGGEQAALWDKKETFGNLQVVMDQIPDADMKILRTLVDQIRDKLKERTLVLLAAAKDGKVTLCLGVTKDIADTFSASKILQPLAKEVGGTGGGRNDFAQAGGTDTAGIPRVFDAFRSWLKANT